MRMVPRLVVSDHCAQDDDELSHDGGDRDLGGLSPAGQPFGEIRGSGHESGSRPEPPCRAPVRIWLAPPENSSLSALLPAVVDRNGASPPSATAVALWDMSELRAGRPGSLRGHGPDAGQGLHEAASCGNASLATSACCDFCFDQRPSCSFKRRKMRLQGFREPPSGRRARVRHVSA